MYYEVERLLMQGERVVLTGLKGTGKSYLVSKLSTRFNTLRNGSWWSTQWVTDKQYYECFRLFDRCPWIDRYAYIYRTKEALPICVKNYITSLPDTYLLLMLDDRFRKSRDDIELEYEERERLVNRFLEIGQAIYETGKIRGVIVTTPKTFMCTDYWTDNNFWEVAKTSSLTGRI